MNARSIALDVLERAEDGNIFLEDILDDALRRSTIDHRDKRFVFELVYGVTRNRSSLDYTIRSYFDPDKVREAAVLMRLLRLGAYQIIHMRVPDYAAVDESVKTAKSDRRIRYYAGTVNAVLRTIITNKKHLPLPDAGDLIQRLSVEFSHPRWLVGKWLDRIGLVRLKKVLTFNNTKPDIFVRRKLRGLSRQQFESEFRPLGAPAGGYLNLFYRLTASTPEHLALLREGHCTVQAPSSGWATAMLEVAQGEHLLDLCSAPGGKALLMAELASERGTVCCADVSFLRLKQLVDNARRMEIGTMYPVATDGTIPGLRGHFDKILIDAPCSGTGVLHRHPEGRWRLQPEEFTRLATRQRALLESAAHFIGQGGIIVYATCSTEPEENEHVVETFLRDHPQFVLEKPPTAIPQRFVDLEGFLRITPWDHAMDGIFATRLRRKT